MYILADIKRNCRKSRFMQKQRRLLKKFRNKKNEFFNEKDSIFYKYICKMYILADIKWFQKRCDRPRHTYRHTDIQTKRFIEEFRS